MVDQITPGPVGGYPPLGVTGSVAASTTERAREAEGRARRGDLREASAEASPFAGSERVAERGAMPEVPPAPSEQWGSMSFGECALNKAHDKFADLLKTLEGLGTSPEDLKKSSVIQATMQMIQQVINTITKVREMVHESIMRTCR